MEETKSSDDRAIALNMRKMNYEQFKTLVRMHLSFELDLNTDEFDFPSHEVVYYEKGKEKKWNRLSKKMKGGGCTAPTKTNSPPDSAAISLTVDFIEELRKLKEFLLRSDNVIQEGIFRRTGAVSRQNELRSLINLRKEINLSESYTVHDCATVYKGFLSDLSEPLLTDAHYPAHCQIADLCNGDEKLSSKIREDHLLHSMQLLLLLLPEENRMLLQDIIEMLHTTAKYEKSNKMSPNSLATLFTPHLICPRNLPPEALHYVSQSMSNVISYMIVKGSEIFDIPPKLATDIRAYSLEQKRKKTMSPEQILDESISDISTVNTVYTFVDREKTAEAHNSNPTDTALAQLYAHIQTLPESSKKRKLIKQFNKENGQGTPLQFLMLNRIKAAGSSRSAKSIGDSIKKHIFQRNIMTRTPKRSNASPQFDTPNSVTTTPKIRVLFQSPNPSSSVFGSSLSSKKHPLQKSISSSSLLTATTSSAYIDIPAISSSAPISRVSSDLSDETQTVGGEVQPEPFTILRETVTHWNKKNQTPNCYIMNCNDIDNTVENNLESCVNGKRNFLFKYNSEPDLGKTWSGNTIKRKVGKSSSVSDLKYSCGPENHYKFKNSNGSLLASQNRRLNLQTEIPTPIIKERYDLISYMDIDNARSNTPGGINICRNRDLITSTPSLFIGRRSMSPITKSTQRMPKSMQESIMTPRSRKPVMLAATIGLLDQNQTAYQGDLSSFREQDEDSFLSHNTSTQVEATSTLYRSFSENDLDFNSDDFNRGGSEQIDSQSNCIRAPDSLTNTFRKYLLSRSVLTTSPVDSSFSSHSDDFGSTPDIRDLDESEMNASLLFCLDGNRPNDDDDFIDLSTTNRSESNNSENLTNGFRNSINRKRAAIRSENELERKENHCPNETTSRSPTKKILVLEKNPNETSL